MSEFVFKQFKVNHDNSSMKVGVDAVLLGSWARLSCGQNILDVGTGCGVIALICAQRSEASIITAIDVDDASIEEASGNFAESPWSSRLKAEKIEFGAMLKKSNCKMLFDHIISNPPYFNSGVIKTDTPRMKARHQGELSPGVLILESDNLLKKGGKLSMIVPAEEYQNLTAFAAKNTDMRLSRATFVRGRTTKPYKRVLLEFIKEPENKQTEIDNLTIHKDNNDFTDEYKQLTSAFYLKF